MSRSQGRGAAAARSSDVHLRTFPSDDQTFHGFSRAVLLRTVRSTPGELQVALRERYPAAIVRVQDELARRGDTLVWYAFRYGSIVDAPQTTPVDWDGPEVAEGIVDDDRRFVAVDDALARIVELPREQMLGRALEDFTNPDDPTIREDMARLWAEFVAARAGESTIRFNRADGRARELAYRIVADDPVPGQHRLRVREMPQGQMEEAQG